MDGDSGNTILLNKTRKEAWLCKEDYELERDEDGMFPFTIFVKTIMKEVPFWSLEDSIVIYRFDNLSYYTLKGYKELNFITYNKEAHFINTQVNTTEKKILRMDLYTMFLYLSNATLCISDSAKKEVFNAMAYKLMEWDNVSRVELREVFVKFDMKMEELCSNCNESLNYDGDEENPVCKSCAK